MHFEEADHDLLTYVGDIVHKKHLLAVCDSTNKATDCLFMFGNIENIINVVIVNLNINSLPNKFDDLKVLSPGMSDILMITDVKWSKTFPVLQLLIYGYRLDRNDIIIPFREDITSRLLTQYSFPFDIHSSLNC